MKTELSPKYSNQVSFYKKAYVIENGDYYELQSYNTIVLKMHKYTKKLIPLWDGYSRTTMTHINEFLMQNGLPTMSKKEWLSQFENNIKYQVFGTNGFCRYKSPSLFASENEAQNFIDMYLGKNNFWYYYIEQV